MLARRAPVTVAPSAEHLRRPGSTVRRRRRRRLTLLHVSRR